MDAQVGVVSGVGVPPDVPHPHVVASVGQDERQALIDEVCQPVGGATQNTVLEEEYSSSDIDCEGEREKRDVFSSVIEKNLGVLFPIIVS